MNPLVTIITPVYNRGDLLKKAIKSVLNQTFRNFEYIIVDDFSTENIKAIVEEFNDQRIIYIKHLENKMISEAYNTGIKESRGKYIATLETDDIWHPSKLEKQLKIFDQDKKIGVVYCGMVVKDPNGNILRHRVPKLRGFILENCLYKNPMFSLSVFMVKKDTLDKAGYFDKNFDPNTDYDLMFRLAKISKFDFVDEILVDYLEHDNNLSIMMDVDPFLKAKYNEKIFMKHKDIFMKYPKAACDKLRNLGISYIFCGERQKGRKYFLKAFKICPQNLKVSRDIIFSFLPIYVFKFLFNLKNKIKDNSTQ